MRNLLIDYKLCFQLIHNNYKSVKKLNSEKVIENNDRNKELIEKNSNSKTIESPQKYCMNCVKYEIIYYLLLKIIDFNFVLKINRKYDFENYLSTLLLKSSSLRRSAFAIRAFNAELSQIRDLTSTQLMAQLRLQFWFDLMDQIYNNEHISSANQPIAYEIQRVFHLNYFIN